MTLNELAQIEWDSFETTADWTKLLNELLGLIDIANAAERRGELADALDSFADHSTSDDLDVITRLNQVARKTARALRKADIATSIGELQSTSAEFQAIVKEFSVASAALRKEASALRAEKFTAAVSSLTETISSLKLLSQAVASEDQESLAPAIAQAVASAQALRELLEKPQA